MQEKMERRVETSAVLAKMILEKGRSFLGNIITMNKSVVSKYNPKIKAQSKQWLEKKQRHYQDKVKASQTKQMVFAFFDNKWTVYTHYVPSGTAANADYLAGALRKVLKAHHQKWPDLVTVRGFFHWYEAQVHTA